MIDFMPMKTKKAQAEYQREWYARRRMAWFADKVCIHCGSKDRLELDHIDPVLKVSHNIWSWSLLRREAELAKCQVLCHDCHLKKTSSNQESVRGSKHGKAVLTEAQVKKAREMSAQGIGPTEIGRTLGGFDRRTIWYAVNNGWKHIE
jgi:hypothetical protein